MNVVRFRIWTSIHRIRGKKPFYIYIKRENEPPSVLPLLTLSLSPRFKQSSYPVIYYVLLKHSNCYTLQANARNACFLLQCNRKGSKLTNAARKYGPLRLHCSRPKGNSKTIYRHARHSYGFLAVKIIYRMIFYICPVWNC